MGALAAQEGVGDEEGEQAAPAAGEERLARRAVGAQLAAGQAHRQPARRLVQADARLVRERGRAPARGAERLDPGQVHQPDVLPAEHVRGGRASVLRGPLRRSIRNTRRAPAASSTAQPVGDHRGAASRSSTSTRTSRASVCWPAEG